MDESGRQDRYQNNGEEFVDYFYQDAPEFWYQDAPPVEQEFYDFQQPQAPHQQMPQGQMQQQIPIPQSQSHQPQIPRQTPPQPQAHMQMPQQQQRTRRQVPQQQQQAPHQMSQQTSQQLPQQVSQRLAQQQLARQSQQLSQVQQVPQQPNAQMRQRINYMIPSVGVSPALAPSMSPALAPVPMDPMDQIDQPMDQIERELMDALEPPTHQESESDIDTRLRRAKFKATSSIPPDVPRTQYAAQCIAAATSSRLPPFRLHPNEYNILRDKLPLRHVTTYLNVRNGILRLWVLNPTVAVTMVEAAGCARSARFFVVAEFAYEWLVRNGYINHGCCLPAPEVMPPSLSGTRPPPPTQRRNPRPTVVIVGAGVAGLAAARQLESLCRVYRGAFAEYADTPKVMILESRQRIGGRIHSVRIQDTGIAELGASTIPGFGGGNPMGTLLRRQLGLPAVPVDAQDDLYSADSGDKVDPGVNYRAHELFGHLLDRMAGFNSAPAPITASGDKVLIQAGRDPPNASSDADETRSIADTEDRTKPYHTTSGPKRSSTASDTAIETKFLQELGYTTKSDPQQHVHITARPSGGSPSLGKTMDAFLEQLEQITELSEEDVRALAWYYAKFEYLIGDCIDKVSLSSWSHYRTNRFTGQHSWLRDGLCALPRALSSNPTEVDVRYQTEVKIIEYENDDGVQLQLGNGDQVKADKVIVTVPLGVLKKRTIQFIPDLPQWKIDSIERLGFGTLNKVVLAFNKCFWDKDAFTFRVMQKNEEITRGECFMFQNQMPSTGQPVLTALVSGEAANELANIDDKVTIDRALESLKRIFNPPADVKLTESFVTRWQLDPHAYGAYSYVGVDGTIVDHDLLGRPVQQSLFFAGEGTSRFYPGTVHGAYLSGLRVAKEVLNSLVGSLEVPENLVQSFTEMNNNEAAILRRPSPINLNESQRPSARSTPQGTTPRAQAQALAYHQMQNNLKARTHTPVSVDELEHELVSLRRERENADDQHMERDLLNELGERPAKPERSGNTNPFLLFQKDYWDICRKETEDVRKGHASRNEIRATLGKRWKSLPEDEKKPYIDKTQKTKENNEQQIEAYVRNVKWYDSEADNFRRQWKIEHPEKVTDREKELVSLISELNPKPKRHRLTD